MIEPIPLNSVAAASLVLALLFALRYALAMRRIFQEVPRPEGYGLAAFLRPPQPGAFGDEMEPNRRYATRQYGQAALFLVAGLSLLAWIAATGAPLWQASTT